jgi:hypothetical protein
MSLYHPGAVQNQLNRASLLHKDNAPIKPVRAMDTMTVLGNNFLVQLMKYE